MSIVMTANEARKFMKVYRNNYINGQLKVINSEIALAVQEGDDHICLDMNIDKDIENMLKNLGYDIEKGTQYNNSYIIIKW